MEYVFIVFYYFVLNGVVENVVRILKKVIKKVIVENKNIELILNNFLLYYCNIEYCFMGESLVILLMGRCLRIRLDVLKLDREGKVCEL